MVRAGKPEGRGSRFRKQPGARHVARWDSRHECEVRVCCRVCGGRARAHGAWRDIRIYHARGTRSRRLWLRSLLSLLRARPDVRREHANREGAGEPSGTRLSRVAHAYQVRALTGFIEPTKIG